jgi:carbon-monoxide dehydrogenase large subunit
MGEGGTIGALAAIANALAPFAGGIFELPMTPERLYRLLEKLKR